MTASPTVDVRPLADVYNETRARLVELIRTCAAGPDAAAAVDVPACPGWTVRDVLAHVTGNYADIVSGNLAGAGTPEWTGAQVEQRRVMPIEDLLAESDDVGPKMAAMVDDFPGWYGNQVVGDLAVHEQDVRGALEQPGARDSHAVGIAVEFLVNGVVAPGAAAMGLGPLEIVAGGRSWVVGSSRPDGTDPDTAIFNAIASADPSPKGDEPPVGRLSADAFEIFRALTGRRSAAQVARLGWTVDHEPFLPLFNLGPFFSLRSADLIE